MDVLFIHGNYPGQFLHLAPAMAQQPNHRVVFLTNRDDPEAHPLRGVTVRRYDTHRETTPGIHSYLRGTEQAVLTGQGVIRSLHKLIREGFRPQLVIAHGGNGLLLFLRQLLPQALLVGYFEWWFRDEQARWLLNDTSLDAQLLLSVRNGVVLQELELCDLAVTPTHWQRQQFPPSQQRKLQVVFDGVDTNLFRPQPWTGDVVLQAEADSSPITLQPQHRVFSYGTRGMEPLRGFPEFMRLLPSLMERFADLQVVVAGRDRVAYSYPPPDHQGSWKATLLAELEGQLDRSRLHFTGLLSYRDYVRLLQRSDRHVVFSRSYITSWGLFQAAACGSPLLLNTEPSLQHVLKPEQAVWGDLDQPQQLEAVATEALAGAFDQREQPRNSALRPEWELGACLQRWQLLLQQGLQRR